VEVYGSHGSAPAAASHRTFDHADERCHRDRNDDADGGDCPDHPVFQASARILSKFPSPVPVAGLSTTQSSRQVMRAGLPSGQP
jgi:hypothetical protein